MPSQYIDRSEPLHGFNRTLKDVRLPYTDLRSIKNFRLTDGRAERRPGFKQHNDTRIADSVLTKATATVVQSANVDSTTRRTKLFKSPLSYALLRWHDDFQLKTSRNWTIEYIMTLGDLETLVKAGSTYNQKSAYAYTSGSARVLFRQQPGVYIIDQSVLVKSASINATGWTAATTPQAVNTTGTTYMQDVFVLSTFATSFDVSKMYFYFTLFDTINSVYYPHDYQVTLFLPRPYATGDTYHVAITYDFVTRAILVLIDGIPRGGLAIPANYVFAGQQDAINGRTDAIQRDFVLLNECMARGGYSSTCKVGNSHVAQHGNFALPHYSDSSTPEDAPWVPRVHSPPRGTQLAELRFWNTTRTNSQINSFKTSFVPATSMGLVGYWKLNDGGPICYSARANDRRYITVHHGEPVYVADSGLVHRAGIVIADNQCIHADFGTADYAYVDAAHRPLTTLFSRNTTQQFVPSQDFTIQIQIRTPTVWQQELNRLTGSATLSSAQGDTRDSLDQPNYQLKTGSSTPGTFVGEAGITPQHTRAYDSTLFSIESAQQEVTNQIDSVRDATRVPIVRALLTPAGLVAFEYFTEGNTTSPRYYRLTSATTLTLDTVYTLTFVRKTIYTNTNGASAPTGCKLLIYINGSLTADRTLALSTTAGVYSTVALNGGVADVLIGTSAFNDKIDKSIRDAGWAPPVFIPQRYMSPYQDQPGFFTFGFFRLWSNSLPAEDFSKYVNSTIEGVNEYSTDLVFNIEAELSAGPYLKNRGVYGVVFELDYKGWGDTETEPIIDNKVSYPAAFSMMDRLGWAPRDVNFIQDEAVTCRGLAVYSSTLSQIKGLLSVFQGSLLYDKDAGGRMSPLSLTSQGLLNDFYSSGSWQGVSIADRTVLTGPGGYPKVFNGKAATILGPGKWRGGLPKIACISGGNLDASSWFGVRIIYVSETTGVLSISPVQAVRTSDTFKQIEIREIAPSPDPRVSSIYICRTIACATKALAEASVVSPIDFSLFENEYIESYTINNGILATTFDATQYSPAPVCAYAASLNDRLYLAGDPLVPDKLYWTPVGQPEVFDNTENQLVLEESEGDKIVGLVALFGALYVFKANSIWRVIETGDGVHQKERVTNVGPVSDRAISVVTIPDAGRTVIVFWSQYGPYIYDTVKTQYIGFPLEGGDADYDTWMDVESVFISHDEDKRELIFYYKSRPGGVALDRHDKAVVYNYRTNTWVEYEGIVGNASLTSSFIKRNQATANLIEQFHLHLIGGTNGFIYQWNKSAYDGMPNGVTTTDFKVTSYAAGVLNFGGTILPQFADHDLRHLWATVISKDQAEWFSAPIIDNTTSRITIDTSYATPNFNITSGCELIIGVMPCYMELPWDDMGLPYADKQITHLITWNKQDFRFAYSKNWNTVPVREGWMPVADSRGARRRTTLAIGGGEVLKTQFISFEPEAALNAFGYVVEGSREATQLQ